MVTVVGQDEQSSGSQTDRAGARVIRLAVVIRVFATMGEADADTEPVELARCGCVSHRDRRCSGVGDCAVTWREAGTSESMPFCDRNKARSRSG